jgi:beta-phosphoglucomutase-like phosphatase (HAD superfamily)
MVGESVEGHGRLYSRSARARKNFHFFICEAVGGRGSSATQVARGNPAADLFLFAAAQMRAAPNECLVIEDSVAGVTAAVVAGMQVIGLTAGGDCRPGHAERLLAAGASDVACDERQLQRSV